MTECSEFKVDSLCTEAIFFMTTSENWAECRICLEGDIPAYQTRRCKHVHPSHESFCV